MSAKQARDPRRVTKTELNLSFNDIPTYRRFTRKHEKKEKKTKTKTVESEFTNASISYYAAA